MKAWVLLVSGLALIPGTPSALFDGESLSGWTQIGGKPGNWGVAEGLLVTRGQGKDWLSTNRPHADFILDLEYRIQPGGNSGVLIRAPHRGDPSFDGLEVQILDDDAPAHRNLKPEQYTGSVYGVIAARRGHARKAGEWNRLTIQVEGPKIQVNLNDVTVVDDNLTHHREALTRHPGIDRASGYVGLQSHGDAVEFRALTIRDLNH